MNRFCLEVLRGMLNEQIAAASAHNFLFFACRKNAYVIRFNKTNTLL